MSFFSGGLSGFGEAGGSRWKVFIFIDFLCCLKLGFTSWSRTLFPVVKVLRMSKWILKKSRNLVAEIELRQILVLKRS